MKNNKCKSLIGGIKSIHLLINGEWFEVPKGFTKKEYYLFKLLLNEYFNG
jgi:hypothetical protein